VVPTKNHGLVFSLLSEIIPHATSPPEMILDHRSGDDHDLRRIGSHHLSAPPDLAFPSIFIPFSSLSSFQTEFSTSLSPEISISHKKFNGDNMGSNWGCYPPSEVAKNGRLGAYPLGFILLLQLN
jgi:hypothetical protein